MAETTEVRPAGRVFCTFRAGERLYGIDVAHLREVSTQVATTPVPQAPAAVRGLTNLRSRVYLVIDLRPLLGLAPAACTADSRLIILRPEFGEDLGLLVDSGGDVVRASEQDIEAAVRPGDRSAGNAADSPPGLSAGVCKLESELMVVLDVAGVVGEVARQIR